MACVITIDPDIIVTETEGGEAFAVTVSGTATACQKVLVTLKCGRSEYHAPAAAVDDTGTWSVEFKDIQCECFGQVLVDAVCEDGTCSAPTFSGILRCPPRCPIIQNFSVIEDGFPCTRDAAHRTVSFALSISGGTEDATVRVQYDEDHNRIILLPAGGWFFDAISYDYPVPREPSTAQLIIDLPEGCPSTTIDIPALDQCPCPELYLGEISCIPEGHCVNGKRTVTLDIPILGEGAASYDTYHWFFGDDEEPSEEIKHAPESPQTTHAFLAPGSANIRKWIAFSASIQDRCEHSTRQQIVYNGCEACSSITQIFAEVGECTEDHKRRMYFDAEIDGQPATRFDWDFGNGNRSQHFDSPETHEDYETFGPHTVRLTIRGPEGCESDEAELVVDVPECGGEGWGCVIARFLFVILSVMASLALWVAVCVPGAAPGFFWVAAGLAASAAILLGFWYYLCDHPCGWGLLLGWQVVLGIGLGALDLANCCGWLWAVGLLSIGGAVALFREWQLQCRPSFCRAVAELMMVMVVVLVPVLDWLGVIPGLHACEPPFVDAIIGTIAAIVAAVAAGCMVED